MKLPEYNIQPLTKDQQQKMDALAGTYEVVVGGHAKINREGERFWVKVTTAHEEGYFTGTIDNDLIKTHLHGLSYLDKVTFSKSEVLQVL